MGSVGGDGICATHADGEGEPQHLRYRDRISESIFGKLVNSGLVVVAQVKVGGRARRTDGLGKPSCVRHLVRESAKRASQQLAAGLPAGAGRAGSVFGCCSVAA